METTINTAYTKDLNLFNLFSFKPATLQMPLRSQKISKRHIVREILFTNRDQDSIEEKIASAVQDMILILKGSNQSFQLFITGDDSGKVSLSFVFPSSRGQGNAALRSCFPGLTLEESSEEIHSSYEHYGYMTGIPSPFDGEKPAKSWMRAVLRSKLGKRFEVMLTCAPIKPAAFTEIIESLSNEYNQYAPFRKITTSSGRQESYQSSETTGQNNGENILFKSSVGSFSEGRTNGTTQSQDQSSEAEDISITKYTEILTSHLDRMYTGLTTGMWQCGIFAGSDEDKFMAQLSGALHTAVLQHSFIPGYTFMKDQSLKSYMETGAIPDLEKDYHLLNGYFSKATNLLNSAELATLLTLPDENYPGYQVREITDFSVQPLYSDEDFSIGHFYNREQLLNQKFTLSKNDLTMHGLVTGLTGSGKTNTILSLLENADIPYLIIEPTKQEYRHLLSINPDIQVYTMGNEKLSPIRLNPFYFPEGVSLLSHIDSLKAVFLSAFSMYASMPNILEQCLYSVYKKNGWSLHHSTNIYAENHQDAASHFPTLKDLYEEIDDYVSKSGYAEEQKSNIRAALLTRLKSLMAGSKGLMLNTKDSLDFAALLSKPTILELEEIADDDDKALLMGLMFIRISQELKLQNDQTIDRPLKHITILEEAHRIFSNIDPTNQSPETANTRGKAVEHFCNLLSEIRSMGESIIIVDQIPTKLAPDAIKNTNLKIVHRLVASDDAKYMCQSLSLDETKDSLSLSKLKRGEALVFKTGMEKAAHILMKATKAKLKYVTSDHIREHAVLHNRFIETQTFVHPIAEIIMEQDDFTKRRVLEIGLKLYRNLLFEDLTDLSSLFQTTSQSLLNLVYRSGYDIDKKNEKSFIHSLLSSAIHQALENHLYFSKIKKVRNKIGQYLDLLVRNHDYQWSPIEAMAFMHSRLKIIYPLLEEASERLFSDEPLYQNALKAPSPYTGEAFLLAASAIQKNIYANALSDMGEDKEENAKIFFEKIKNSLKEEFIQTTDSEGFLTIANTIFLLLRNKDHSNLIPSI